MKSRSSDWLALILDDTQEQISASPSWMRRDSYHDEIKRIDDRISDREDRLRMLGFEEITAEQCKANLALNVALREWPKD